MAAAGNDRLTERAGRLVLLTAILLLFAFPAVHKVFANNETVAFAEKVNLALRRTAHLLLVENGDSLSRIPPVAQPDANTFIVVLDRLFDYDKLPVLLQQSLTRHGVSRTYHVTLLNCDNEQVELGYSYLDLKGKGGVPCAGRLQAPGCFKLKVSFDPEMNVASGAPDWWLLPFGSLLGGLGYIVWKRKRKKPNNSVAENAVHEADASKLSFGNSVLDMSNLHLISGSGSHHLTYREAKLLHLFANHLNQVLERDFILKSVWEDEGVIVGRSVDVFVSRLRKMLQGDPQVKITAVHGVGYRMDISS